MSGAFPGAAGGRDDASYVARIKKNTRLEELTRRTWALSTGGGAAPAAVAGRRLSLSRTALSGSFPAAVPKGGPGPLRDGGGAPRPPLLPDHRPEFPDDARPGRGRVLPSARPFRARVV